MFAKLVAPTAELESGVLTRRSGLFYRRRIPLAEVERVVAVLKDALTHEEVTVVFLDGTGERLWLSEFDKNFSDVMKRLEVSLPGFASPVDLVARHPFEGAQRILWQRHCAKNGSEPIP